MRPSKIDICGWCLNDFINEGQPREMSAKMRESLLIADDGFEPVICERCLEGIGRIVVKAPSYALMR